MRSAGVLAALAAAAFVSASPSALSTPDAVSPVDWVNTYIGTGGGGADYGGTMPLVTTPFGMTNWTAQTRQNRISVSSYAYEDSYIEGFIGTHQPAIWMGDYGYVTLVPEIGSINYAPEARRLSFTHKDEVSTPYYYSVKMGSDAAHRIDAEMTATDHAGYLRFTYPRGSTAGVLIEATRPGIQGFVKIDAGKNEIVGYNPDRMDSNLGPLKLPNFKGYFVVRFKQPFVATTVYEGVLKLGVASVEGATDDERHIFYSGLYHALLYPKLFSEHGRYYTAFDDKVHPGVSYTAYSLWDTFRAENSFLTLLAPERIDAMVQALLQDYQEGGWMPKWPNPSYTNIMIATHADAVVAEAINKGFHGFDYHLAYKAVYKDAMTPPAGDTTRDWHDRQAHVPYEARAGLTYYKQIGYVPVDKTAEAASATLEDAYDDFAVAQVAKAVGKDADYRFFIDRSRNYRNLYNPATGFMQGRNADGSWADADAGWTEGDKWVYTYSVLHDIPGLMALLGGAEKYNATLDEHFRDGHNHHDNEPSHHYGYLYDFSGQPWKTQARVRQIANDYYSNQ